MNRGLRGFPQHQASVALPHLDMYAESPSLSRSYNLDFSEKSAPSQFAGLTKVNWTFNALEYDGDSVPGGKFLELASATAFRAAVRPLPLGNFDAVAHFAAVPRYGVPGIVMSDGTTAGAGNQVVAYGYCPGTTRVAGVSRYTNFTTFAAVLITERDFHSPHLFVRINRTGSTFYAAFSENGRLWSTLTSFTPTGTMAHIGLLYAPVSGVVTRFGTYAFRIYQPALPRDIGGLERRLVALP